MNKKEGGLEEYYKERRIENLLKIYCVLLRGGNVNKHCFPCEHYYVGVMVNIKNQIFLTWVLFSQVAFPLP